MKRSPPVATTLTLLCSIVTLVTLVTLVPSTNAQRATVSLGSKLIQPKDKKRKWGFFKSPGHVDAIELEEERDLEGEWIPIWTAGFVGLVSLVVFMMKVKQKRDGGESGDMATRSDSTASEEFVLENGKASEFLSQCEVGFEDIKMVLQQKGKKPDRVILDGSFKGNARPGRMLAIMGPSGSGKSTLLHAIAGRIKASKKIALSGTRYINQQKIAGDCHIPAAVIEQESNFFPHMTVKETLDFRVELKLGSQLPKAERDDVVANLMDMLGLVKSANTIVGDNKVRGLSGGERKRLSIACEMISSPPILLLDEPTSGLDSYQATQVMEYIRKLADSGKTVIAVIHQPSQKVFSLFDDLLLVSDGRMLYNGEVNNVRSYLHNLGFEAESDTGTAEHVLECISPNTNGGPEMEKKSKERLDKLGVTALDTSRALSLGSNKDHEKKLRLVTASNKTSSNGLKQFKLLLGRSFKELVRGKGAIIIKIVQQVTLGVIYGGIYKLGDNQGSVMDRIGLISLITIGAFNMAMASTIRSFTKEKTIVSPEMAGGMYKTFPYFLAKAVSEIPIAGAYNAIFGAIIYPMTGLQKGKFPGFFSLTAMHTLACQAFGLVIGAIAPNTDVALSLFPPFIVLNIIFDGRNISVENTPRLLRWLPKIGVVKWAFQGLSINEFTGLSFSSAGPRRGPLIKTGEDALAKFGLADVSLSEVFSAQRNIIGVCWLMSYLSLSLTKQKYQKMVTP